MLRKLILVFFCLITAMVVGASDFLPAWQAFQVSLSAEGREAVWLKFKIAPEYHLYQNKIQITTLAGSQVKLGKPSWPDPQILQSPDLGSFRVYEKQVAIRVPINSYANGKLRLLVSYQGCKGLDLCFPEQHSQLDLNLNTPQDAAQQIVTPSLPPEDLPSTLTTLRSLFSDDVGSSQITAFFANRIWLVIGGFFGLGLLIAFTPCVFPLLPILLALIAGPSISSRRSFSLALSYVLGGAVTYALAGLAAASLGYSLAGFLQSSWLNLVLSGIFVVFALALFGAFELQLPIGWQNRLNQKISRHQGRSSLVNAFIIGSLANLILSPCVSAPLAGALIYISTSGDKILGAGALFALALGSGLPLLLIAVFGKQALPKNGPWLLLVKKILAMLMLGMALYMLSKVLAKPLISVLALAWLVGFSTVLLFEFKLQRGWRYSLSGLSAAAIFALGFWQLNIIEPETAKPGSTAVTVTNLNDLDRILEQAKANKQPVMLDFYAKWCIACAEMDLRTLANPKVINLLQPFKLVRVDLTASDQASRELQQRYQVIAPPSLVFLNELGRSQEQHKITGFIDSAKLSVNLGQILSEGKQCLDAKC